MLVRSLQSGGLIALLSFLVLSAILGLASVEEAMRLYAGGRQAEARQMLEAIAKAEPANFDAHFRLGLVALNAQDLSTAAASLNRASQLRTRSRPSLVSTGTNAAEGEKPKSGCGGSS